MLVVAAELHVLLVMRMGEEMAAHEKRMLFALAVRDGKVPVPWVGDKEREEKDIQRVP